VFLSSAFERICGVPGRELIGRAQTRWLALVHRDDLSRVKQAVERLRDGDRIDIEYRLVRPDGTICAVRERGFPARHDRAAGILQDVTGERRETTDIELGHAQKMQLLGALASTVAHDFNSLLMAIIGFAQLALQEIPPGHPAEEYVERNLQAAERGRNLACQVLDFSRKHPPMAQPVELDAIVRSSAPLLAGLVDESITVRLELGARGRTVLVDEGEIQQILLNLVANARDAMPAGGRVTISTRETADAQSLRTPMVRLAVTDTGVGMSEETGARAFEPFFTTKRAGKGTGLGLAIVREIVRRRSGTVHLASEPGEGTTVAIDLPLVARRPA